MIRQLLSAIFLTAFIGLFACSNLPTQPPAPVPWVGKFTAIDHRFDLYIEAPDPADPNLVGTYLTPVGKSKDDPDSFFRLFRLSGDSAFSTHVRRALEKECPHEMHRNSRGIELIDLCGGAVDQSGFYEWLPTKGKAN